MVSFFVQAQTCTITCNLTTAYLCSNSNSWKKNPEICNDADMMKELVYTKNNRGCWELGGTNPNVTIKTSDKPKGVSWWERIKKAFSGAKKTGF